jgi:hypothetical protein
METKASMSKQYGYKEKFDNPDMLHSHSMYQPDNGGLIGLYSFC